MAQAIVASGNSQNLHFPCFKNWLFVVCYTIVEISDLLEQHILQDCIEPTG